MPFCPNCRDEFEDWVKLCPDCHIALVNELPPLPKTPFPPPVLKENWEKFRSNTRLHHGIIGVLTVIILLGLLAVQPWSNVSNEDSSWIHTKVKSGQMDVFTRNADGMEQQLIELSWIYPDRYSGKFLPNDKGIEFIFIGKRYYSKDAHPQELFDDRRYQICRNQTHYVYENGAKEILDSLIHINELPEEKIHSVDCLHYEARIDMDYQVDQLIEEYRTLQLEDPEFFTDTLIEQEIKRLEPLRKVEMSVEYWISKSDGIFRQLIINTQELLDRDEIIMKESYTRVVYYNINHPFMIRPPETLFRGLLPGWQLYEMN